MVRACIEDQATSSTGGKVKRFGTVDNILHKELDAFTSFDFDSAEVHAPMPAAAAGSGGFIDPRAWSSEADWPEKRLSVSRDAHDGPGRITAGIQRDTVQEMPARPGRMTGAPPSIPTRQEPSPMPGVQLLSQPVQLPVVFPPPSMPPLPERPPAHRGILFGVMAGAAAVLGAIVAYWLFSGR
jgi:hypothetical protein